MDEVPQYAGKSIDYNLNPVTFTKNDREIIETQLSKLLNAVEDFTKKIIGDKKTLSLLGLPEDLDLKPTPLGLHIPFARFDFLYHQGQLQVLELNTDGTSGYNVVEWLNQKARLKDEENPNLNLSERLLKALHEHNPKATEICLVDFQGQSTSWEQTDLIQRWNKWVSAKFVVPGVRSWREGALCYRRALSWQLRAQKNQAEVFLSDWESGKITVVGGWSSDVGMSKAWPCFLKTPLVPETLLMNEETMKRLSHEKDLWILKGALSFSGRSLVSGYELTQDKWIKSLGLVLSETKQGRSWVAQKKVNVPLLEGKPVEYGLYFLNGKPAGYLCRWGHSEVISETSKEITRPVRIHG